MKKKLLVILLTIFTLTLANAQKKINLGVKGGVNFSNMSSDYFAESDNKTGFHVGLIAEIPIINKFSIQPEILYSEQGTNASVIMLGGGPMKFEYKLDYIQVPILAKLYVYKKLSIEIGPSFNFLTYDKKIIREDLPDIIIGDETFPQEKYFDANGNSFEFSGIIGISYKFMGGFFGNARYIHGMSDAIDSEVKNNSFQIGIGYFF